jgi:ribulose-phosphate 3-epimerase
MTRRDAFLTLRQAAPAILPSMLLCDFGRLAEETARLEAAGARSLHLDVMDGHFVPNLTYGFPIVQAFRRATELPLDVHLMVSNPRPYLKQYAEAGADCLTVHAEAVEDLGAVLDEIRALGVASGVAINPPTSEEVVIPHLGKAELILVMSVMPGFGGQAFDPRALDKLRILCQLAPADTLLEVDGGVNAATIASCAQAGADLLVVGSAIFRKADYRAEIEALGRLARGADPVSPRT